MRNFIEKESDLAQFYRHAHLYNVYRKETIGKQHHTHTHTTHTTNTTHTHTNHIHTHHTQHTTHTTHTTHTYTPTHTPHTPHTTFFVLLYQREFTSNIWGLCRLFCQSDGTYYICENSYHFFAGWNLNPMFLWKDRTVITKQTQNTSVKLPISQRITLRVDGYFDSCWFIVRHPYKNLLNTTFRSSICPQCAEVRYRELYL